MKVYMGPYHHWFQPARWYADWFFWFYGLNGIDVDDPDGMKYEARLEQLYEQSFYRVLQNIEEAVNRTFSRKIQVKVHDYDVWGLDSTLAVIILPLLKRLRESKRGAPYVDDEDVPAELRSTAAPPVEDYRPDANHFKRWEYALNEMIWSFEQIVDEVGHSQFHSDIDPAKPSNEPGISFAEAMRRGQFDKERYKAWQNRKTRGLTLFGKYFEALWD